MKLTDEEKAAALQRLWLERRFERRSWSPEKVRREVARAWRGVKQARVERRIRLALRQNPGSTVFQLAAIADAPLEKVCGEIMNLIISDLARREESRNGPPRFWWGGRFA